MQKMVGEWRATVGKGMGLEVGIPKKVGRTLQPCISIIIYHYLLSSHI